MYNPSIVSDKLYCCSLNLKIYIRSSKKTVPRLELILVRMSIIAAVLNILLLIVPHLFFPCVGCTVLRDRDLPCMTEPQEISIENNNNKKKQQKKNKKKKKTTTYKKIKRKRASEYVRKADLLSPYRPLSRQLPFVP